MKRVWIAAGVLLALGTFLLPLSLPQLTAGEEEEKSFSTDPYLYGQLQVNPQDGELTYAFEKLAIPGSMAPSLKVSYQGLSTFQGRLGLGWMTNVETHLDIKPSIQQIVLLRPGLEPLEFKGTTAITYVSQQGPKLELKKGETGYRLENRGTTYRFDLQGKLISITNQQNHSLKIVYSQRGLPVQIVDNQSRYIRLHYRGNQWSHAVNSMGGRIEFHYDERDSLSGISDPSRGNMAFQYDTAKRLTRINEKAARVSYDGDHRVKILSGKAVATRTYSYREVYSPQSKIISKVTDSRGETTTYEFSKSGRTVGKTDPLGRREIYYFNQHRLPTMILDSGGKSTRFRYDGRRNMVAVTGKDGRTTRFQYTPFQRIREITRPNGSQIRMNYNQQQKVVQITYPDSSKTRFDYDENSRLVRVERAGGYEIEYRYDGQGRLAAKKNNAGLHEVYGYDNNGRMNSVKQGDLITKYNFSEVGKKLEVKNNLGFSMKYEFNHFGKIARQVDYRGRTTNYKYNHRGQVENIRFQNGSFSSYKYNSEGRLISMIDRSGRTYTFGYDKVGRPISWTDPMGHTTRTTYNKMGLRATKVLADGAKISYRYDENGRMTSMETPEGTDRFRYDDDGRVVAMKNDDAWLEYSYDVMGRVTRVRDRKIGETLRYTYNQLGLRRSMSGPEGTTRYQYDKGGRLVRLVDPRGEAVKFKYQNSGRKAVVRLPNGITTSYDYDSWKRLKKVESKNLRGQVVMSRAYQYDKQGRVRLVTDEKGRKMKYYYDALGRLKGVAKTHGDKIRYRYDNIGNRIYQREGKKKNSFTYDKAGKLVRSKTARYKYDKNGNLTAKMSRRGTTRYHYDSKSKLRKVDLPDGQVVRYGYAPNGQRAWKRKGGQTIRYLQDFENVLAEYRGSSIKGSYLHGQGIDEPLGRRTSRGAEYYLTDGRASVVALTNRSGHITRSYDYKPFGETMKASRWDDNPYRFTGRWYDNDTGLYYFRARHYSAEEGRFTSRDPLLFVDGTNMYSYCKNDPINYVDPYGTFGWWNDLKNKVSRTASSIGRGISDAATSVGRVVSDAAGTVADAASHVYNEAKSYGNTALLLAGVGPEDQVNAAREGFVKGLENNYVANQVVNFVIGVGQGLYEGGSDLVNAVLHPIETAKNIYHAIVNYEETWEGIKFLWNEYVDAAKNDPAKFARMTGSLVGQLAFAVAGTKGLDKLAKAKAVTNLAQAAKARTVAAVGRSGQTLNRSARLARLSKNLKKLHATNKLGTKGNKKLRKLIRRMERETNPSRLRRLERQANDLLARNGIVNKPSLAERVLNPGVTRALKEAAKKSPTVAVAMSVTGKAARVLERIRELQSKFPKSAAALEKSAEQVARSRRAVQEATYEVLENNEQVQEKKTGAERRRELERRSRELQRRLREAEQNITNVEAKAGKATKGAVGALNDAFGK